MFSYSIENSHLINLSFPQEELMGKLELFLKEESNTSAKQRKENVKEKENRYGPMALIIMENGKKIKQMEKANLREQMEQLIRGIFKMTSFMVTGYTQQKIKNSHTKEDLTSICSMVMELKLVKGSTSILEILKMTLRMVMAPLSMIMELFTKELGKKENLMDKELIKVLL